MNSRAGTGLGGQRLAFEVETALETGLPTGPAGLPRLIAAFRQTGPVAFIMMHREAW